MYRLTPSVSIGCATILTYMCIFLVEHFHSNYVVLTVLLSTTF